MINALWLLLVGLVATAVILRLRAIHRRRERFKTNDLTRQKTINRILAGGERHHVQGIYERVEPMRKFVERAIERLEAAIADKVPEATNIYTALERSGEAGRLLQFLVSQRQGALDVVARSREIATLGYLVGDIETASRAVDAILALMRNDIDALTRQGTILYLRGDTLAAKQVYLRVLKIAAHNHSDEERAAAHISLGLLHQLLKEIGDAEVHHGEALRIFERLKNEAGMADCLVNIGLIHQGRNEAARAERVFREAVEINERLQRPEGQAVSCLCLGLLIYHNRGNLEEAERLLGTALDLNSRLGRLGGMASAYGNLGLVRFKRGDAKGARELFNKSLTLYQKINRPKLALKVQTWLAQLEPTAAT
jgi:tetratricopeptide (TPR) repeat protein